MITVQSYIDHFLSLWEESPVDPPVFSREYSEPEKKERENNYLRFQNKMKEMRSAKKLNKYRKDPAHTFFPIFKEFLETVFDFEKSELNIILSEDFKDVSKDFFHKARAFGPELKPEDIYQGMRNVWIMNGIQLILDIPVQITNSVFAYSMIYPYSDNLLDQDELSEEEKDQFCKRFNERLHGENIKPEGFIEEQLFKLIGYFEEEFARSKYPGVYDSLYAIQTGQTNSLKMIHPGSTPESVIKNICFEKGGASVLADGYLVAGN